MRRAGAGGCRGEFTAQLGFCWEGGIFICLIPGSAPLNRYSVGFLGDKSCHTWQESDLGEERIETEF